MLLHRPNPPDARAKLLSDDLLLQGRTAQLQLAGYASQLPPSPLPSCPLPPYCQLCAISATGQFLIRLPPSPGFR